ncbi:GNAT family N-acetyltransferase [Changchengzhania lutea]|uniref:GNAT family N-acetyltransferase n=1 Tax=Changchengzhania lutea TaxID=2049305 RepID=UPI00115DD338|nr:GNAT family N-acetyltransferase [Changchengzhania lutea]
MIEISIDKGKLQKDIIHNFLKTAYWAKGRTLKEVERSINHSLCFGVYLNGAQIGFARVVTDYVVFAYLMDVFILPEHQGNGYSKELMKAVNEEPKLQSCKVWMLKTSDAHNLYQQYGYTTIKHSEKIMERLL